MLDRGTTSHMTPKEDREQSGTECDIDTHMTDDSTVIFQEARKDVRKFNDRPRMQDSAAIQDAIEAYLSPSLGIAGGVGVLEHCSVFHAQRKTMFNIEASYKVLDEACQYEEGLFYIEDQQDGKSQGNSVRRVDEKAMMAIAHREAAQKQPKESDNAQMSHRRLGHALLVQTVSDMWNDGRLPHTDCKSPEGNHCGRGKFVTRIAGTLNKPENISRLPSDLRGQASTFSTDSHMYFLNTVKGS